FQAEDGIRDDLVTGVQTCALPISVPVILVPARPGHDWPDTVGIVRSSRKAVATGAEHPAVRLVGLPEVGAGGISDHGDGCAAGRSEERRVGKGCGGRWASER